MEKKKMLKYIGQSVVALVLLVSVIGLYVSVQDDQKREDASIKVTEKTRLNVAVVNEDKSVTLNEQEYNLGASYVKNIERDSSQNWSVVPRGAADTGLANGKYQLVITIPSDFSEKILEVNSINAEKTTVSYKVNAAGNQQVENEANKVAKDIIADLNSQLVDMYMVSILSNLYTAQKNVQLSSKVQTTNIDSYRNNLLDAAIGSRNIFPNLYSLSTSSVASNNALKSTLESYTQVFDELSQSQDQYGQNFEALLQQRAEDKISHEAFMQQLLSMNQEVLSEKTKSLYSNLQHNQEALTKQLSSSEGDADQGTQTYAGLTKDVNQRVKELESGLEAERKKLEEHQQNIQNFVRARLESYYNLKEGENVTLKSFFGKGNIATLEDAKKGGDEQIRQAVEALPTLDLASLNLQHFHTIQDLPHFDGNFAKEKGTPKGNANDLKALEKRAEEKTKAVVEWAGKKQGPAKMSLEVPNGLQVTSWSYNGTNLDPNGEQEVTLTENGKFAIHFTADETANGKAENSIGIFINGVPVAEATVKPEEAYQALQDYAATVTRYALAYERAQALIDAYYPEKDGQRQSIFDPIAETDVTTLLADLLTQSIQSNLQEYSDSLSKGASPEDSKGVKEKLDDSLQQLKDLGPQLENNLKAIEDSNNKLTQDISEQLAHYEDLQKRLEEISKSQETSNQAQTKTDSDLSALGSEYTSLLSSTAGVKSSSQSNIEAASATNEIFSQLNKELETAQGNTEKLSTDAQTLMGQFDKELSDNGNFVEAFRKVFNNAYENGVPNEVLLDFLSNPVAQQSSSMKATINVYRPFTWIFLLEVMSLFIAYLFATQPVLQKVKDRLKLTVLQDSDWMGVAILAALALVDGLVIGMMSSLQLSVGREYVPSWILLMIVASFVLVQGQYLLLKHFRVIGMGLSFFMLISFVYLSSAIGTTATVSGLPAVIKHLNLLSIFEGLFAAYFDGKTAGFLVIFGFLVLFGIFAVANIFIPKYQQTKETVE